MPPQIYRDSISNAHSSYSNPFDTRNHPNLVRARQEAYLKSHDSFESRRERLERDLLLHFRDGLFTTSRQASSFLGKSGRALINGILTPTYFLFVGMPKKLFTQWLVPAFQEIALSCQKLLKPFRRIRLKPRWLEEAAKKIQTPLKSWSRQVQKMQEQLRNEWKAFWDRLTQKFDKLSLRFTKRMDRSLSRWGDKATQHIGKWFKVTAGLSLRLKQWDRAFEKFQIKWAEKVHTEMQLLQRRIDASFVDPINQFLNRVEERYKKWSTRTANKIVERYESLKEAVHKFAQPVIEPAKAMVNSFIVHLQPLQVQVINLAQMALIPLHSVGEVVEKWSKKGRQRGKQLFQWGEKKYEGCKTKVTAFLAKAKSIYQTISKKIERALVAFLSKLYLFVAKIGKDLWKWAKRLFQNIEKGVIFLFLFFSFLRIVIKLMARLLWESMREAFRALS